MNDRTTGPARIQRPLAAVLLAAGIAALAGPAAAAPQTQSAPPAPPESLTVTDAPDDGGQGLVVAWRRAPGPVTGYALERALSPTGPFAPVDTFSQHFTTALDQGLQRGHPYWYRLRILAPGGLSAPAIAGPTVPVAQWFRFGRVNVAVFMAAFFALVLYFLWRARQGRPLFVRRIPGIDAIEEAVGRATEMGRPVLYIPGILNIDEIQTIAALVILESVARTAAQYDTKLIVPTAYPVVFTLAQEAVKSGYAQAGRPEAYDPNCVRYVTTEQFAYAAAINGIILRDRPAANLYLGAFFAESLMLAETGYMTKAIQVAGTAMIAQLPFLVVACDYTLIGEELYAASAYLSREPRLLSTLKGSDYIKVAVLLLFVIGAACETLGFTGFTAWFQVR